MREREHEREQGNRREQDDPETPGDALEPQYANANAAPNPNTP